MYFQRERHAAENMIKLMYLWDMPEGYPWIHDAMELPSLVEQYLRYRGEAEKVALWKGSAGLRQPLSDAAGPGSFRRYSKDDLL